VALLPAGKPTTTRPNLPALRSRFCLTSSEPHAPAAAPPASGNGADARARDLGRAVGADHGPAAAIPAARRWAVGGGATAGGSSTGRSGGSAPARRPMARPAGAPRPVADGPRPPRPPAPRRHVDPGRPPGRGRGRPLAPDPAARRERDAALGRVGRLEGCRSVATRLDELAVGSPAVVGLACVRLLLRRLRPSDRI
jgi:hypothetical protein